MPSKDKKQTTKKDKDSNSHDNIIVVEDEKRENNVQVAIQEMINLTSGEAEDLLCKRKYFNYLKQLKKEK